MTRCEWITKIEDGEEKTDEFTERDDQCDCERCTFRGEDEDTSDTDILCDDVTGQIQPHHRYPHIQHRHQHTSCNTKH